jgi:hypothetical protein
VLQMARPASKLHHGVRTNRFPSKLDQVEPVKYPRVAVRVHLEQLGGQEQARDPPVLEGLAQRDRVEERVFGDDRR